MLRSTLTFSTKSRSQNLARGEGTTCTLTSLKTRTASCPMHSPTCVLRTKHSALGSVGTRQLISVRLCISELWHGLTMDTNSTHDPLKPTLGSIAKYSKKYPLAHLRPLFIVDTSAALSPYTMGNHKHSFSHAMLPLSFLLSKPWLSIYRLVFFIALSLCSQSNFVSLPLSISFYSPEFVTSFGSSLSDSPVAQSVKLYVQYRVMVVDALWL